jgi:hypothetical protein
MPTKAKILDALNAQAGPLSAGEDSYAGHTGIQIVNGGSFVGTITYEGTISGTWVTMQVVKLADGTAITTSTSDELARADTTGLVGFRARVSAYTSGYCTAFLSPAIG